MATQNASNPASRNSQMNSKVAVGSGKAMLPASQHITGKLGSGMSAMPGAKGGKGQSVTTVKSNPISGAANVQAKNTSMGNGSIIPGKI